MVIIYILMILTVVFAISCVSLRRKGKSFEGMVFKFVSSFAFMCTAITGNFINGADIKYFSLIIVSLMFGFCGDVFLGIKEIAPLFKKKLIILGTSFFLLGHISSISAIFSLYGFNKKLLPFFLIFILVSFILCKIFKVKAHGGLLALLSVYYSFLLDKVLLASCLLYSHFNCANVIILTAAVLFLISDSCLGLLYFTPVKKKNVFVTAELLTYYPAQLLFALSVALL